MRAKLLFTLLRMSALALIATTFAGPTSHSTDSNSSASSASVYHEVRLRKLHLVRPDLISYPILYEVYC